MREIFGESKARAVEIAGRDDFKAQLERDRADHEREARSLQEKLGRDPTDVECFDMGQSNSEHSRHWFFGGKMVIDGEEKEDTLFQMVKATLPKGVPNNSVIAFHDNSSAIKGYECDALRPSSVRGPGSVTVGKQTLHPILTAETHNFPSGVAPFPGAETGTGGRLRPAPAGPVHRKPRCRRPAQ